jgi:hypothetical protein
VYRSGKRCARGRLRETGATWAFSHGQPETKNPHLRRKLPPHPVGLPGMRRDKKVIPPNPVVGNVADRNLDRIAPRGVGLPARFAKLKAPNQLIIHTMVEYRPQLGHLTTPFGQ